MCLFVYLWFVLLLTNSLPSQECLYRLTYSPGECQLVLEVIDLIPNPIFSDVALRVGILGHWVNTPAMQTCLAVYMPKVMDMDILINVGIEFDVYN